MIVSWSMKVLSLSRCLELSSCHNHETLVIVSWSMKVLSLSRCLELSSFHNHETPRDSVLVYEGVVSLTVPRTNPHVTTMRHLVIVSWSMKVLSLSRCLELSSYHNHETPRDSVLVYEGVESLKVPRTILTSQP